MAYITRHLKDNGKCEITKVDGNTRTTYEAEGIPNTIVPKVRFKNPGYNAHSSGSAAARTRQIADDLNRERSELLATNGFSKKKTIRKIASIPEDIYWSNMVQQGMGDGKVGDSKELTKLIKDNDFNVVPKNSF